MDKYISLFFVAALLGVAPSLAHAQTEDLPASAPAEASAVVPTVESLRSDLREMEARHDKELKELRTDLDQREAEAAMAHEREAVERDRLLRIYGFADIGIKRNTTPEDGLAASEFKQPLTFFLGRLNLYYDSHPDPDFRFLAETRLSLYPNGASTGTDASGQVTRTSTTVSDVSSPNSMASVTWGSIILERAVLDWTRYSFFSVRVGLFLTPFGVYNVDHGTPTLITTMLPIYISQGFIPERQLGIQIFGSHPVDRWELGYAATVSNGRTDGILDVGDSKAFGGRLFARRQGKLQLLLGASALYQPYRRDREQFGFDASGAITYTSTRVVEYTNLTLGGDLSLDYSGLRVRSEYVYYRQEYTTGKRDSPAQALGGQNPDNTDYNWNIVIAYRWWSLEPYVWSEFFHASPTISLGTDSWIPGAGLNWYIRPNVILKGSYNYVSFHKDNDPENLASRQNFHTVNVLLTWAF